MISPEGLGPIRGLAIEGAAARRRRRRRRVVHEQEDKRAQQHEAEDEHGQGYLRLRLPAPQSLRHRR